jgi:hypothetical protein
VDNDVSEIFHFPPINRRIFISERRVDSCDCFSNNLEIAFYGVLGFKITQVHVKSYTSGKILYVAYGFENILKQ